MQIRRKQLTWHRKARRVAGTCATSEQRARSALSAPLAARRYGQGSLHTRREQGGVGSDPPPGLTIQRARTCGLDAHMLTSDAPKVGLTHGGGSARQESLACVQFSPARAGSRCQVSKNPGQCRTNYSSPGLKQRSGELNIHKVAAAACSRRPASARMQMSRSDSRAARLDEDDEMESSTRFRSRSLRLRQRDLDDAPSGRQERDEEVEAALLSLEKSQRRPCQTELKGRPLRTFLSGS